MRSIYLYFAVLAAGCATARPDPQAYVQTFRDEAKARGVTLDGEVEVVMVATLGGPAGKCYADTGRILLARDFWEDPEWSDVVRREAVYHELGHCLLRLPHTEHGPVFDGHPLSVMTEELQSGGWYGAHESLVLDRLFARNP